MYYIHKTDFLKIIILYCKKQNCRKMPKINYFIRYFVGTIGIFKLILNL